MFAASFHGEPPAKARKTPPVEVSKAVGSENVSVAHEADTETAEGEEAIQGSGFKSVHAVVSEVAERFSENTALMRSIFPFEFESRTVAERRRGTALSTESLETGERAFPARSSSVQEGA
ncbi:MAG: hypothetical protein WA194_06650 [Patescibacteria group bacterium]